MTRVKNAFVTEDGKMVPIYPSRGQTPEGFVTKLRVSAPGVRFGNLLALKNLPLADPPHPRSAGENRKSLQERLY
jgi:hypothetical protein